MELRQRLGLGISPVPDIITLLEIGARRPRLCQKVDSKDFWGFLPMMKHSVRAFS